MASEQQNEFHDLGNGRRRIFLNAFDMFTPTHMNFGQWKNPADKGDTKRDLSYWTNLAKTLERGGFLSLFIADTYGGYETYEGSLDNCVARGVQWPVLDPIVTVSAMAAVTESLGFGVTGSTAGELPFLLARRYSTLDHLTKGRIAWNIVTSWKKSAFKAIGFDSPVEHDERYLQADEYLRVMYKLWEGSWADDAVAPQPEKDLYIDANKVRDIKHHGKYFKLDTKFIVDPSPQRTPFLFQAGTSPAGIAFASQHAEGIFLGGFSPEGTAPKVANVRAEAAAKGRDPRSVKFFSMILPILGRTDEEAQEKYEELKKYASTTGGLVFMSGILGMDLSQIPMDQELKSSDSTSAHKVHSQLSNLFNDQETKWTPRMIAERAAIGGLAPLFIGSPQTVADAMERWIKVADIDGFTIVQMEAPGSFEDIVDLLVPELRRRGIYPEIGEDEAGLTMREKVYGKGQKTLREDHVGRTYKFDSYKEEPPYEEPATTE
ncbi:luciferase-like domain-containing protein [Xylariales sp. PMI_506]|nr:luciferase-like domain-containing protein [Xylariales sp. PMI_506]